MAESTKDLHVHIDVHIDDEEEWEYDHHVPVPPDYTQQDMEPFILHEIDRAVVLHQREHYGYSRSADIIHQYDLRLRVIEALIRLAPHAQSRAALGDAIRTVIHLDADELLNRYENARLED